ncbi:MAG: hypothetical protein KAT17_04670 [Candidatus Aminicenantes bacterium]|nr:hypothetical protein [Candidatus Aminicenantes bacterium]
MSNNIQSDSPRGRLIYSMARKDIQRISKALIVLFCDFFLKGDKQALNNLTRDYLASLCGRIVDKIDWYTK